MQLAPARISFDDLMLINVNRVVLLNYREDGVTPYVIVWKHGVTEMKV
jgi:hypothetical protein